MKLSKEEFGKALIEAVLESFRAAYLRHRRGESLESILILHDIVAAGSDVDPTIVRLHQRAIKSACAAVDNDVEHGEASRYLRKQMEARFKKES